MYRIGAAKERELDLLKLDFRRLKTAFSVLLYPMVSVACLFVSAVSRAGYEQWAILSGTCLGVLGLVPLGILRLQKKRSYTHPS